MTCQQRKLNRVFTPIFCYKDSHYVKKANEQIEQEERCAYKGIPLSQHCCYKTGHMKFSSHRKMRSTPRGDVPLSWQKSRKLLYGDR